MRRSPGRCLGCPGAGRAIIRRLPPRRWPPGTGTGRPPHPGSIRDLLGLLAYALQSTSRGGPLSRAQITRAPPAHARRTPSYSEGWLLACRASPRETSPSSTRRRSESRRDEFVEAAEDRPGVPALCHRIPSNAPGSPSRHGNPGRPAEPWRGEAPTVSVLRCRNQRAWLMNQHRRASLPRFSDRLGLGRDGLRVSPFCIGMTRTPETVIQAYAAGINFFFLSADLHWPLYEPVRQGLTRLLAGGARRQDIVVAVASYLDEPLFRLLQFHEVLDAIPGLQYVDLLIAGAISNDWSLRARAQSLADARSKRSHGASAIGATFHQRACAVTAVQEGMLDIVFNRFNVLHQDALRDLFPYIRQRSEVLNYNFKNLVSMLTQARLLELGFSRHWWLPDLVDQYRFVLSRDEVNGILCAPASPSELWCLAAALEKGPLSHEEQEYFINLLTQAYSMHLNRLQHSAVHPAGGLSPDP